MQWINDTAIAASPSPSGRVSEGSQKRRRMSAGSGDGPNTKQKNR